MINVTFICGAPCSPSQVTMLKERGYKMEDVAEHLITTKYGDKMFKMKNGTTVIV